MVLSVKDVVEDVPDEQREFLRHIRNSEKLCAQGFSPRVHLQLDSSRAQKAAGNAYPPALLLAQLHPIVEALVKFDLAAWPPASVIDVERQALLKAKETSTLLAKPCKKSKPAKPCKKKMPAKRKRIPL